MGCQVWARHLTLMRGSGAWAVGAVYSDCSEFKASSKGHNRCTKRTL